MRWEQLFDDLEAQLAAADAQELAAEVGERTRVELGRIALADRIEAWQGEQVTVLAAGGVRVTGEVRDVSSSWVLLTGQAVTLVPLAAVTGVVGLGVAARPSGAETLARRLSLASALRAIARDRGPVRLRLVDGEQVAGTVDAVAADHLDLAEHEADQPRRGRAVRQVRTVPFAALAAVEPMPGATRLG